MMLNSTMGVISQQTKMNTGQLIMMNGQLESQVPRKMAIPMMSKMKTWSCPGYWQENEDRHSGIEIWCSTNYVDRCDGTCGLPGESDTTIKRLGGISA